MKLESMAQLFSDEIADLQSAEKQLIKALPKMAKAASSEELRNCFEEHLAETRGQAERLEQISGMLEQRPKAKSCKAMAGLIEEGGEILKASGDEAVIDAALIAAAQRVEHYEIAGYGCARTYAEMLGLGKAARLLQASLDEEKAADKKLNEIALNSINREAVSS